MYFQALGTVCMSIGFFCTAIWFLQKNIRALFTVHFQEFIAKHVKNSFWGGVWGFLLGICGSFLVTFVTASLFTTRAYPLNIGIPLVMWSNLGAWLVITLFFLDIHLLLKFLIGLAGILLLSFQTTKFNHIFGSFLGACLLFYAIILMGEGINVLIEIDPIKEILIASHEYLLANFLIGSILTFFSNAGLVITALSINMAKAGILTTAQTIMILLGIQFGSCMLVWVVCSTFKGRAKQVIIAQVLFSVFYVAVFMLLLYIEKFFHIPLIQSLLHHMSANVALQMAFFAFFSTLAISIFLTVFLDTYCKVVQKIVPVKSHL